MDHIIKTIFFNMCTIAHKPHIVCESCLDTEFTCHVALRLGAKKEHRITVVSVISSFMANSHSYLLKFLNQPVDYCIHINKG